MTETTSAAQRKERVEALEFALRVLREGSTSHDRRVEFSDLIMAVALGSAGIGDVFADALWAVGIYGSVEAAIQKTKEIG